ncbi:RNA recognition motif protein (macronuclear) [Tetrahymena thermophila SB210]|uniref:RNA recognition motif protein n=1 Tax=Tetrahymena thermophila (strain SB210) TaxID=312017 RepID=Q23AB7_TETTS|nr:RNA recognition motif protein [Tetrahymena thermophila SB210]EAR93575.3 RNA recognition motif protein [Tetrahymena thermophila SB210]|eukprot:XP_001013820.3 RNA recognition motif protein [Tetrahymena thermophila SB210]
MENSNEKSLQLINCCKKQRLIKLIIIIQETISIEIYLQFNMNINQSTKDEMTEQKVSLSSRISVSDQINELKQSKPKETRVLLVTLVNNVNNTVLQHNVYYQAFSNYGEVQRILIFQKISPWATFIEMDTVENARNARQKLNNFQILPDGTKFVILPSTKERIEFQEKNVSGIDYTILKQKILERQINNEAEALFEQLLKVDDIIEDGNSPQKQLISSDNQEVTISYHSSQSSNATFNSGNNSKVKGIKNFNNNNANSNNYNFKPTNYNSQKNSLHNSFSQEEVNDQSNYSHMANESSVHTELDDLNLAQSVYSNVSEEQNGKYHTSISNSNIKNNSIHSDNSLNFGKKAVCSTTSRNQGQSFQKQGHNLTNSAPNDLCFQKSSNSLQSDIYENVDEKTDISQYVHPQFSQMIKKSKVIYVNRFDSSKTTMQQIFNLFSAFGNIVKMIFMKSKSAVLIEYSTVDFACQAKDLLSDTTFNGNIIKIFYSRYENIFFKEAEEKPEDEEYFEPNEKLNRFKSDAQAIINTPIDTLHISNIRINDCNFETIKKITEPYGQIKKIKFMLEKNNKNMCLVKFETVSIAMWVLANVHNKMISDRPIKISFSKRTLE